MQIALVAVVLLAGMWFTVLRPKPQSDGAAPAPAPAASAPVAPGVKGLATAVDKAKGASATSDATNARIQSASGAPAAAAAKPSATNATATKKPAAAAKPSVTKAAVTKKPATAAKAPAAAAKPATPVDPSDRLLAYLPKGKTLVILFYGNGAEDRAARKAVHRTAQKDPKHVVSAYVPIAKVGAYEAITSGVDILTSPTILVIGKDRKATALTGFIEAGTVKQAVGDSRRAPAAAK
jgi:hypothetical protein